jgi:hypothetical protein
MARARSFRLVAAVRARHRDRSLIDAFVLDRWKNAVVPKRGEGVSVKRQLDMYRLFLSSLEQLLAE